MLLGWLVSGDPMVGLKVGGLELFTKMVLYYFHERAWYNFGLGIPKRKLFKRSCARIKTWSVLTFRATVRI